MEFRILGPLEVVDEGRPVLLDRPRSRALLAYLLLHANQPVPAERLVDRLWGERPPRTATASLQNYVARLRRTLGAERVRLEPGGYVLRVDPERFDLARFDRLVAEARATPARERAQLLRAALSLWRGEPLEDLALEEFAQAEIAHLAERRLAALEERVQADLELGGGTELLEELEALVTANPVRERLHGQLMLALYRAGRQADALAAYVRARRTLLDELGLEPSEALRALERSILNQDPALLAHEEGARRSMESRRTVTILVCAVVDSLRIASGLDPEAYRRLMARYSDAVGEAVEAHGGSLQRFFGETVTAFFGIPDQREDDALRAVYAAVGIRKALMAVSEEARREWNVTLGIRIAVNTGEVFAAGEGADVLVTGAAINLVNRLERRAGVGEIVLGEETRRLVGDAVRVEPIEPGDDRRAWRLVRVIAGAPSVRRRFDASLIGRDAELRRLLAAFERVRDERTCGVVTVIGEAGIGKTLLARELVASLDEARVLIGRCVSYGAGATYLPLVEIVRQAAGEASVAGIAQLLRDEDDADEVAGRVAELVGFAEGPAAPGEAFWAVRRLLEALARERPLLVVLDDLHWAEPTLLDLIEYLGEWAQGAILVLCCARRELLEDRPAWAGPGSTGFLIEVGPLPPELVGALVGELARGRLDARVGEQIVERAGGNPLFAEQLFALVNEVPGGLVEEAPPTVEALIASRLDRLGQRELDALRRAAVIGRRFSRAEAQHLGPMDDAIMVALERRGLIHPTEPKQEEIFRFHHMLVRDVAYRGIPKADRADLHERAAEGLDRRDGPDELVGYHLEQAYLFRVELARADDHARRLARDAGDRLGRAGIRAWKRGDAPAAANLLGRASALLPDGDAYRAELLCELGVAVWAAGDAGRADEILRDAVASAAAGRHRAIELRARLESSNLRLFHGDEAAADELLDVAAEAVPLFEEIGDSRSLSRAWLLVSYVQGGLQCGYSAALEAAERARDYSIRSGWPATTQQVAAALYCGPKPVGDAVERCEALLESADRVGEANTLVFLGGLCAMKGNFDEARHRISRAQHAYDELGLSVVQATTLAPVLADVEMLAGSPSAAEELLRGSCEAFERMGERVHLATQAAQLADALYAQVRDDEAHRWTRTAEASSLANDVSAQLSWRAVRGKVLARAGAMHEAEALARAAVGLAEQTDALNHHGRVLLDLAEVLRLDDRLGEASEYVEEALSCFERKGNSVSARRARTLLDELAIA